MHDLQFAREINRVIKAKLKEIPRAKVQSVKASLSPLSHVTPESLKQAFESLLKEDGLEGIDLSVDILDIEINCKNCDNTLFTKRPLVKCPRCQHADLEIKLPEKDQGQLKEG